MRLPEDLIEHLRERNLGQSQKRRLRELSSESAERVSAEQYTRRYVRRMRKILTALRQAR